VSDTAHRVTDFDVERLFLNGPSVPTSSPPTKGELVTEPMPSTLHATLHTNRGDIRLQLFPNHAPKTVCNFVELAEGTREWQDPRSGQPRQEPFFDGLSFHRIIPGFMIQGGCPLGTGTGGPGYAFDDEIHPELSFTKPYLLAMANAGKRMGRGTNGSQFFVTIAPTTWLQGQHTIFGEVADASGREVVDEIVATPTDSQDRPEKPVVIERVSVERG
jgi:peptidyl-prolyl cis-trans isomerase A (cyclophilin A)